jgi:3-isopropylmalate dehydrogenase
MKYTIATIPGDGIGPDVVAEAVKVARTVAGVSGFTVEFMETLMGGAAIDATGSPLPDSTLRACRSADAILLGAVGGPRWDSLPGNLRPEAGLLGLRAAMGAYANLRPARIFPELAAACPLKPEIVAGGMDLLIVRELTGGIYFGERGKSPDGEAAWDTERYTKAEIERLLEVAFRAARSRKRKLCVVDKANVLESSRLWRQVAQAAAARYPDVETTFMYVDNCAMQLVRDPRQFDVIATSNMFGDILSDEASMITGSIGMLPSASIGDSGPGIFEPIHGSAPDLAGKDQANPLATILSAAMLLSYGLGRHDEAALIEGAVSSVLAAGCRCADIATGAAEETVLGTRAMGEAVARAIEEAAR